MLSVSLSGIGSRTVTGQTDAGDSTASEQKQQPDLAIRRILEAAVKEHPMPGVVAAIAKLGSTAQDPTLRIAAVGVRKYGDETALGLDDQVHLGSCTKAITASMIARLVERGQLAWDTPLKECLPDLCKEINSGYHDVTLSQLLMHQSGAPRNAKNWRLKGGDDIEETRRLIAVDSLAEPPENAPGESFEYSNLGYLIAGLMASKKTGKPWEQLVQEEVFDVLHLSSAGFGPPGKLGEVDQPWGHIPLGDGRFGASQHDNPPALGPAGTIHMTIKDWAIFALEHARKNGGDFLTKSSLSELHRPDPKSSYAKGWLAMHRGWGKGTVLFHNGSNNTWYASLWIGPEIKSAYLVVTNTAGADTIQAVDSLVGKLIKLDLAGD